MMHTILHFINARTVLGLGFGFVIVPIGIAIVAAFIGGIGWFYDTVSPHEVDIWTGFFALVAICIIGGIVLARISP